VHAHGAHFEQARELVRRAARLRPLLTYALPIVAAQALLQLAHAYHALADPAGARATLRQLKDLEHHRPGLGNLPAEADELRSQLDVPRGDVVGVASLTTAELRLLPLLPTHLTLAQISERLFVSRNTVKTQAISVYRKLGVSSRSETVARMHELGLLAPT
jgi:LuxR family maltose regulon positive regulatory protein